MHSYAFKGLKSRNDSKHMSLYLYLFNVLRSIIHIHYYKEGVMTPGSALQGKKVLIIEDDYSYRILLQSILKKTGALCTISINAEYARTKLAAEQFDVLVIDYLLPGHNALEIIRWVREQNILTPAVIVTAYPSDDLSEKCKQEKKVALIAKSSITRENFPDLLTDVLDGMTT